MIVMLATAAQAAGNGIYFHIAYHEEGWFFDGHEAQINNSHKDPVRTGSLWSVVKLYDSAAKDDTWFTMHIIVKGQNIPEPGLPESFRVLMKEMQSLCLNVEVLNSEGQVVEMRETEEDAYQAAESLGISLSSRPDASSIDEI